MSLVSPLPETKRKLLDRLLRDGVHLTGSQIPAPKRVAADHAPVAFSQEQLLLREQIANGIPLYNESITLKFNRVIDRDVLEQSMAEVIRRHEIWRTTYQFIAGQFVQVIGPPPDHFDLPLVDLRRSPEQHRKADVRRLALAQTSRSFDLRKGPLLRATLVAMGESEYWLVMAAHHSIIDGLSVYKLFPGELFAIYQAFAAGLLSPFTELPLQFLDFAIWQRTYLSHAEETRQIAYWRQKLAGDIPRMCWPARKSRPAGRTFRGYIREFMLASGIADQARELSRRSDTTMFVVLLATFYVLLRFYTEQTDLIVGTMSPSGRKRSEVQSLLGYFLNPVALRVDLSDDPTFVELLHRTQIIVSEAISHDDVPFEQLATALRPRSEPSRNPYFDVAISLQPCMPDSASAWSVTSMDAENGGSAFDLYVAFIDRPEGLHSRVQYNPDVFEFEEIRSMVQDFESLITVTSAHPQDRVSQLKPS